MKGNKNRQKISPAGRIGITAMLGLLCGLAAAAQEPRYAGSQPATTSFASSVNETQPSRVADFFPSKPARKWEAGQPNAQMSSGPSVEMNNGQRSTTLQTPSAGEAKDASAPLATPARSQDASLTFKSTPTANDYWRARPVSVFPAKSNPSMYQGSRLRGPFDQTYPRPFPGGGQP